MPINLKGWYRRGFHVLDASPVQNVTFGPTTLTWPFFTPGLSVLRTRVNACVWWGFFLGGPQPGTELDMDPIGIQVAFTEAGVGAPPDFPNSQDPSLEFRYRPTISDILHVDSVAATGFDTTTNLPNQWTTYASLTPAIADSKAQRSFSGSNAIDLYVHLGNADGWVEHLDTSPTFACWVMVEALLGAQTS